MLSTSHSIPPTQLFLSEFQHRNRDPLFSPMSGGDVQVPIVDDTVLTLTAGYPTSAPIAVKRAPVSTYGYQFAGSPWVPSDALNNTDTSSRVDHLWHALAQPNYPTISNPIVEERPFPVPHSYMYNRHTSSMNADGSVDWRYLQQSIFTLRPPSSLSSTSSLSPEPSSSSSSSSASQTPLLGKRKRQCSESSPAVPSSGSFICQWDGCRAKVAHTPRTDEGGVPQEVRVHVQQHFPVTQKQTIVRCLWKSCSKETAKDNLRKHILSHLTQFNYQCPACEATYQRPEKWYDHADRCQEYHAYLDQAGKPRPPKRAKTRKSREGCEAAQ